MCKGIVRSRSVSSTGSQKSSSSRRTRGPEFPARLFRMLEGAETSGYSHLVSWMPDGKTFKIHVDNRKATEEDKQAFVELLKLHFKQTKPKSFYRQLQNYGFERTFKGPNRGVCKHEFFERTNLEWMDSKIRVEDFSAKSRKSASSTSSSQSPSRPSSPQTVTELPPLASIRCTGSKCEYSKTSIIPCRLNNLVLPNSPTQQKVVVDLAEDDEELSLAMNESNMLDESWLAMERKMLGCF